MEILFVFFIAKRELASGGVYPYIRPHRLARTYEQAYAYVGMGSCIRMYKTPPADSGKFHLENNKQLLLLLIT